MGKARRAAKKKLPGTAEAHAGGNPSSATAWPDVASFAASTVGTPPFGSPTFGSPKPFDGGEDVDEPSAAAADVPPETLQSLSDTIAPQNNNYGDSDGNHHHQQRRNSIPMLQPEGQNLKPGENSISSIPVALQQQYATAAAANEGGGDADGYSYSEHVRGGADRNEEDEEKQEQEHQQEQEQAADHEQSYPSSAGRPFVPQEAYYDDLNDADDYKEEEDDDDDDEWAARRSRRSRRRSRDRDQDYSSDRFRHGSYSSNDDAPHHNRHDDDESYSDDGDGDREQNLMDLLNEGISDRAARAYANPHGGAGSDSEAEIDFHDSADLDASIPVGNLASALPPPPPPSSSLAQQAPRQTAHPAATAATAATAAPATDAASAFGISSRWSQFEDDDQLRQMTLEANTAAVMMQMEKHMAKKEVGGGGEHSHDERGQSMGWMEKARSVVAKIDGAKEREHLAAAEAQNGKRDGQLQQQPSLKLGDIQKAVPGQEMEVSISDGGGQGSSDRFHYSERRRFSTSSKGASVDGNRSIMTAVTKDTLDGIDLDAVCFAAAQTFGGVKPPGSFGGSGSTFNNAGKYYDDESTLDDRVEHQTQRGDPNMGNAAGDDDDDDDDDDVDDNEGGSPKYRTAEGEMYYDVGDVPVGREVSFL